MSDTDGNTNRNSSDQIKERLATLEAANRYHKDSLDEISKTLKEVVKVQGMLANQREEIMKVSDSLSRVTEITHNQDKMMSNATINMANLHEEVTNVKYELKKTTKLASDNSRFIRIAAWVVTAIILPLAVAVANTYIKSGI